MAERFLYLPLIGWLFVLAFIVHRIPRPRIVAPIAAAVVLGWSALAFDRSLIWRDELTLFVTSSREHPGIRRVDNNAINAIFELPHIRSVIVREKGNLRLASPTKGDHAAAYKTLLEAHRLFPESAIIPSTLGTLLATAGQPDKAVKYFKRAVELRPRSVRYWSNLGQACMEANAWTDAKDAIAKALELAPKNIACLRIASRIALQMEDDDAAKGYLQKLQHLEDNPPEQANPHDDTRLSQAKGAATRPQSQDSDPFASDE